MCAAEASCPFGNPESVGIEAVQQSLPTHGPTSASCHFAASMAENQDCYVWTLATMNTKVLSIGCWVRNQGSPGHTPALSLGPL